MSRIIPASEFPQYATESGCPVSPDHPGARLVEWPSPRYLERRPSWWPETPIATPAERERARSWQPRFPVTTTEGLDPR